jgi:hypothetical protein
VATVDVDLTTGLDEVAASLPPTVLAQGEWRQLQQELDRLAGA